MFTSRTENVIIASIPIVQMIIELDLLDTIIDACIGLYV